jgi:hypothetical protein
MSINVAFVATGPGLVACAHAKRDDGTSIDVIAI